MAAVWRAARSPARSSLAVVSAWRSFWRLATAVPTASWRAGARRSPRTRRSPLARRWRRRSRARPRRSTRPPPLPSLATEALTGSSPGGEGAVIYQRREPGMLAHQDDVGEPSCERVPQLLERELVKVVRVSGRVDASVGRGDDQQAALAQDALQRGDRRLRILQVLEHLEADHEVERSLVEGRVMHVADLKVGHLARPFRGRGDRLRRQVDADHARRPGPGDHLGPVTDATAGVEHVQPTRQIRRQPVARQMLGGDQPAHRRRVEPLG